MAHDTDLVSELSAYVDGELGPEKAAEIEARLGADVTARECLDALARHKRLIGEAADALVAAGGGTTDLKTAALERELAAKLRRRAAARLGPRRVAWPVQAAAAAALVAVGWFGHAELGGSDRALPAYVSEAVGAHRVFGEDTLRPAEFAAAMDVEALSWISDKIGRPVDVPSLAPLGMAFVGARVHGTREGAILQLIYEDGEGERMSLMLARHPDDQPTRDVTIADIGDGHVGYWSDPDVDYAVVAATSDVQIRALAEELVGTATF